MGGHICDRKDTIALTCSSAELEEGSNLLRCYVKQDGDVLNSRGHNRYVSCQLRKGSELIVKFISIVICTLRSN
jgi:hypothetical protein